VHWGHSRLHASGSRLRCMTMVWQKERTPADLRVQTNMTFESQTSEETACRRRPSVVKTYLGSTASLKQV
jgi:hypothetical protein